MRSCRSLTSYSRRGLPSSADIDAILFHPDCVHVPHPGGEPTTGSASDVSSDRRSRPSKSANSDALHKKQDSVLRKAILAPLEREGVIAATLSEGPKKWQGIVRIPGEVESSYQRQVGVRDKEGAFRRMDLRHVLAILKLIL